MRVMIIPEDFRKDQLVLKPLVKAILALAGRPKAKVEVLTDPLLGGVARALDYDLLREVLERRSPATTPSLGGGPSSGIPRTACGATRRCNRTCRTQCPVIDDASPFAPPSLFVRDISSLPADRLCAVRRMARPVHGTDVLRRNARSDRGRVVGSAR